MAVNLKKQGGKGHKVSLRKEALDKRTTAGMEKGDTASFGNAGASIGGGKGIPSVPDESTGHSGRDRPARMKKLTYLSVAAVMLTAVVWFGVRLAGQKPEEIGTALFGSNVSDDVDNSLGGDGVKDLNVSVSDEGITDVSDSGAEESAASEPDELLSAKEGASDIAESVEADYVLPKSDSCYISVEDLDGLSAQECRLARNELYARHGRLFVDESLQTYFDSKGWYDGRIAPSDFQESLLNDFEKYNRDLIVSYEKAKGYR